VASVTRAGVGGRGFESVGRDRCEGRTDEVFFRIGAAPDRDERA
jgi:hypothetical protein